MDPVSHAADDQDREGERPQHEQELLSPVPGFNAGGGGREVFLLVSRRLLGVFLARAKQRYLAVGCHIGRATSNDSRELGPRQEVCQAVRFRRDRACIADPAPVAKRRAEWSLPPSRGWKE